jgi:hypothetical protein
MGGGLQGISAGTRQAKARREAPRSFEPLDVRPSQEVVQAPFGVAESSRRRGQEAREGPQRLRTVGV